MDSVRSRKGPERKVPYAWLTALGERRGVQNGQRCKQCGESQVARALLMRVPLSRFVGFVGFEEQAALLHGRLRPPAQAPGRGHGCTRQSLDVHKLTGLFTQASRPAALSNKTCTHWLLPKRRPQHTLSIDTDTRY